MVLSVRRRGRLEKGNPAKERSCPHVCKDCAEGTKGTLKKALSRREQLCITHPGQSKVHLHLCHPLPHTGSHPNTERDEAVRVMLVEAGPGSVAAAIRRVTAKPPLWEEVLCIWELGLIVAGFIMAQMELSLEKDGLF